MQRFSFCKGRHCVTTGVSSICQKLRKRGHHFRRVLESCSRMHSRQNMPVLDRAAVHIAAERRGLVPPEPQAGHDMQREEMAGMRRTLPAVPSMRLHVVEDAQISMIP